MSQEAYVLAQKYGGVWAVHPDHPVADWMYEVNNGDTRASYWDWVLGRMK